MKPIVVAVIAVFAAWTLVGSPQRAAAAQPCLGVNQTLSAAGRTTYAVLVANSLQTKVSPQSVHVTRSMQSEPWTLIWAQPPNAEQGVFFFKKPSGGAWQYKQVWGGSATAAENAQVAHWARTQGPDFPGVLAQCFADAVTALPH